MGESEEVVQVDGTAWVKMMVYVWHIQDEQESLMGMAWVQDGEGEITLEKLKKCPVNPEECELHPLKERAERELPVCISERCNGIQQLKRMGYIRAPRSTSPKLNADVRSPRCQLEEAPTVQRWDPLNISKNKCKGLNHIKCVVRHDTNNITGHFRRMLENQLIILKTVMKNQAFNKIFL